LETIELKAQTRTTRGNSPAKAMRREGNVPAVLYGPKIEPKSLSISAHELETIVKQGGLGRAILNLSIAGEQKAKAVMIKELQSHPVSNRLLHVDLYEVSMDREIRVNVPVVTTGTSKGVESGGLLQIIRHELEVLCLPNAIPESINIDITDLDIGDSVHVEDINMDESVQLPHEVNFTILTISSPKKEAVEGAEEGEAVAAAEGEAAEEASEE